MNQADCLPPVYKNMLFLYYNQWIDIHYQNFSTPVKDQLFYGCITNLCSSWMREGGLFYFRDRNLTVIDDFILGIVTKHMHKVPAWRNRMVPQSQLTNNVNMAMAHSTPTRFPPQPAAPIAAVAVAAAVGGSLGNHVDRERDGTNERPIVPPIHPALAKHMPSQNMQPPTTGNPQPHPQPQQPQPQIQTLPNKTNMITASRMSMNSVYGTTTVGNQYPNSHPQMFTNQASNDMAGRISNTNAYLRANGFGDTISTSNSYPQSVPVAVPNQTNMNTNTNTNMNTSVQTSRNSTYAGSPTGGNQTQQPQKSQTNTSTNSSGRTSRNSSHAGSSPSNQTLMNTSGRTSRNSSHSHVAQKPSDGNQQPKIIPNQTTMNTSVQVRTSNKSTAVGAAKPIEIDDNEQSKTVLKPINIGTSTPSNSTGVGVDVGAAKPNDDNQQPKVVLNPINMSTPSNSTGVGAAKSTGSIQQPKVAPNPVNMSKSAPSKSKGVAKPNDDKQGPKVVPNPANMSKPSNSTGVAVAKPIDGNQQSKQQKVVPNPINMSTPSNGTGAAVATSTGGIQQPKIIPNETNASSPLGKKSSDSLTGSAENRQSNAQMPAPPSAPSRKAQISHVSMKSSLAQIGTSVLANRKRSREDVDDPKIVRNPIIHSSSSGKHMNLNSNNISISKRNDNVSSVSSSSSSLENKKMKSTLALLKVPYHAKNQMEQKARDQRVRKLLEDFYTDDDIEKVVPKDVYDSVWGESSDKDSEGEVFLV